MAGARKKSTTRKKIDKPKPIENNTKISEITGKESRDLKVEIGIIAGFAIVALFCVIMYTDTAGASGEAVKKLFFGIFGAGAALMPIILFLGLLFFTLKKFRQTSLYKNVLLSAIFICLVTLFHVNYSSQSLYNGTDFGSFVVYYVQNGSMSNGGLAGALFGSMLISVVGHIGSYIIIITAIIICVILVTGKSLFEAITNAARRTAGTAKRIKKMSAYDYEDDDDEDFIDEQQSVSNRKTRKPDKKHSKRAGFNFEIDDEKEYFDTKDDHNNDESSKANIIELFVERNNSKKGINEKEMLLKDEHSEQEHAEIEYNDSATGRNDYTEYEDDISDNMQPKSETEIEIMDFMQKSSEKKPKKSKEQNTLEIEEPSNEFIDYVFPPLNLLEKSEVKIGSETKTEMLKNAKKLEDTLMSFGVSAKVVQINKGPTVTRYELTPSQGVKVSKIVNLADDIALNLAANGIRIEAPIAGKSAVGIEVPNKDQQPVYLRDVLESNTFQNYPSKMAFGVGKDIGGSDIVADISKMPHLLIAGATGSGKSVCINTVIISILYKASPNEVKLLLVDPKVVELSVYNGIPHLLIPVVTDPKKAAGALNWAVAEMLKRYGLFSEHGVRDIKGYNAYQIDNLEFDAVLPHIVIIIDELSDLMMAAPGEVEDAIMRLAQMARAAGLHLIIATQRPSVDVITGVIKANVPSRLAFSVSSGTDSRTILDMVGAEKLLGKGDMLFRPMGISKPIRVQGALITDKEVEAIVDFIKSHTTTVYDEEMVKEITTATKKDMEVAADDEIDEFFYKAIEFILGKQKASVSMLQREFRIGYNRSARLMEDLQNKGIVGSEDGSKPRKILITWAEFEEMKERAK